MNTGFLLVWVQRGASLANTIAPRPPVIFDEALSEMDAPSDATAERGDRDRTPPTPALASSPAPSEPEAAAPAQREASPAADDSADGDAPVAAPAGEPVSDAPTPIDGGGEAVEAASPLVLEPRRDPLVPAKSSPPLTVAAELPRQQRKPATRRARRSASPPAIVEVSDRLDERGPQDSTPVEHPVSLSSPRAVPHLEAAWPELSDPIATQSTTVEVRIGRVEIVHPAPAAAPVFAAPPPARRQPRGFDAQRAVRRHLDRSWY